MIDTRKTFFFSIFSLSLIFYGLIPFQEPTHVKTPASQIAQTDTTKIQKSAPASSVQKSWFEEHPTLGGAIIGAAATLLVGLLGLIGVYVNRRSGKKEAGIARVVKTEELKAEQQFEQELHKITRNEIELRYLKGIESEHGKIDLYGFQSTANVKVRTLEVFVSLNLTHHWHEKTGQLRVESEDGHHLTPEEVLQRAIRKNRSLLILGDPGSGKTTLLKYYAMCCLDEKGREKLGLKKTLIPIILPLLKVDPDQPFCEALSDWATQKNYRVSTDLFDQWLEKRGALVMLDGLDEISDVEKRKKVCEWIDHACNYYRNSRFVITSRLTGYHVAEGIELQSDHLRADVLDLNPEQQETFLKKWFSAAYKEDVEILENHKTEKESELLVLDQAQEVAEAVLRFLSLEENKSLRQLAGTPVLLQIMAILWKEYGSLTSGRAALYEDCTDYLLDRRDRVRDIKPLLPAQQAKIILRPIALWMQEKLKTDEVSINDLQKRMAPLIEDVKPGLKPEDFIKNLEERAGILQEFGEDSYIFRHKSFREFLAAGHLAEEVHRNPKRVQILIENFNENWWRETLLFALVLPKPVILSDFMTRFLPHKHNAAGFPPLLQQIIKEAPQRNIKPFEKFVLDARRDWQKRHNALQCLRLIASEPAKALVKQIWKQEKNEKLKKKAEEILIEWKIIEPLEVDVTEKISVAEAVSVGVGVKESWHNPIELNAEYLLIPGGKFKYSVTKKETQVPPLYFAKYPITNKLYRRFIDYLGGRTRYEQMSHVPNLPLKVFAEKLLKKAATTEIEELKEYLGNEPDRWAEKLRSRYDDEKRFNGDDQPVVGISWYAAAAYCYWLTELHRTFAAQSGEAEQNVVLRLPTGQEWEWAASGGKRPYPWGPKNPDKTRANYGDEVGQTTPVGSYPAGATPEGLMDMAGNVWEWMENADPEYPDARALRGGSWFGNPDNLRCVARFYWDPVYWYNNIGFRVVFAQS